MDLDNVQINVSDSGYSEVPEERVRTIVHDVLAGKRERFEELFALYHGLVYAMAWNLTGNYDDALDVSQECFIRTFRALCSWKGKAKFSTWLHRIAVNTAIDYIRRESKHYERRIETRGDNEEHKDFEKIFQGVELQTPLSKLQQKEVRRKIFNAINQLKGKQRRCFILRYFADLSIKEVSIVVGCGEGTAKRHLFRARERLRCLLLS